MRLNHDGEALRVRRIAAGLYQRELAARAGCAPSTISMLERGRMSASPAMLADLAKALDCRIADLMADNGARP